MRSPARSKQKTNGSRMRTDSRSLGLATAVGYGRRSEGSGASRSERRVRRGAVRASLTGRRITALGAGMKRFLSVLVAAAACAMNVAAEAQVTDLSITNSDGVPTATPGGSVSFTITAENLGSGD